MMETKMEIKVLDMSEETTLVSPPLEMGGSKEIHEKQKS